MPLPPQFRRSVKRIPTYIIRSEIKGRSLQTIEKCEKTSSQAVEKPTSGSLCLDVQVYFSRSVNGYSRHCTNPSSA
jgi:hypothetical protein